LCPSYTTYLMSHAMPSTPIQTILLVDDDELILRALHTYLEKRGYNVLEAHDGEEPYWLPNASRQ
jgi:CheY-like chemotaxis protein